MASERYYQINIGRGENGTLMSDERWEDFQDDIAMAMVSASRSGLPNISMHYGEGFWNDPETGELLSEPSAYLSTFADIDGYALRVQLARLRENYSQDAIAFISGSDLV